VHKPELKEFGIDQRDLEWAEKVWIRLAICLSIVIALGWGLYWLIAANDLADFGLAIFIGIIFVIPLATVVTLIAAYLVLRFLVPRYRNVEKYKGELDKFQAWWERTQQDFWTSLSGRQLETELTTLFRRAGFQAELTPASGDQGVDIWLYTESGKEVVQCKAHRAPIGPAVARELYGTLMHFGAAEAILVSTSGFTQGVWEYVEDKPIRLFGLSEIIALQEKAQAGP